MIKEQSFEWLLEGCHRIADVAVAYYPNYAYACSAVKALRRSIAEHACLLKDLTDQGYTARTAHLTPVQIGILLSYWGMPEDVYKRQGYNRASLVCQLRQAAQVAVFFQCLQLLLHIFYCIHNSFKMCQCGFNVLMCQCANMQMCIRDRRKP